MTDSGRDWDLLLPYVLITARESPQASARFMLLKFLFGHQLRRLLDATKEPWEEQPLPYRSVIIYLHDMQHKINAVLPTVQGYLSRAQEGQRQCYNC